MLQFLFPETGNQTASEASLTNSKTLTIRAQDPFGTYQDSRQTVFAWKSRIDFSDLQNIQNLCKKPMEKLRYNLIENLTEKENPNFKILIRRDFLILMLNWEKRKKERKKEFSFLFRNIILLFNFVLIAFV